jgi:hypothetical protein
MFDVQAWLVGLAVTLAIATVTWLVASPRATPGSSTLCGR